MRKIFLTSIISTVLASVVFVTPANAHVLIMDTTSELGLVLHVTPADEPIAGKVSNLYFDIQNSATGVAISKATLDVRSADTSKTSARLQKHNNSLNAAYLFDKPGVYTLTLTLVGGGKTYTFNHSLRIAANNQGNYSKSSNWAKAIVVASSTAILVLLIIAFNRRKRIASQSR